MYVELLNKHMEDFYSSTVWSEAGSPNERVHGTEMRLYGRI